MRSGRPEPLYVVHGDRVAAEPAAVRLGKELAESQDHEVEIVKRPAGLRDLLGSLRTLSLFGSGRTVVVVESAVLADKGSAADLLDEAAQADVAGDANDLTADERRAAGLLLQALRLFGIDPAARTPSAALGELPAWALQGGRAFRARRSNRGRGKKQVAKMAEGLEALLTAALAAGLTGFAEGDVAELAELAGGGFPEGHRLILAESVVDLDHPLARDLAERGALLDLGRATSGKGGRWQGLEPIVETLEAETGTRIDRRALEELVRRTLQTGRGRDAAVKADSTERLAAEYRKLAAMSGGETISRELVEEAVEDRGDEDVWGLLDAVGEGRRDAAATRLHRILSSAEDPFATRLSLFGLLAEYARQLTAVAGMARAAGVARGETSYPRFKSALAPRLQADRPYGASSPLAGLHPFRLHRAYLGASRMPSARLERLPQRVLEVEGLLKGGSRHPDVVLAAFVVELAG